MELVIAAVLLAGIIAGWVRSRQFLDQRHCDHEQFLALTDGHHTALCHVIATNLEKLTQQVGITGDSLAMQSELLQPFVEELSANLREEMAMTRAEQAVLRTRVETGAGKRTLSMKGLGT